MQYNNLVLFSAGYMDYINYIRPFFKVVHNTPDEED